MQRLILSVVVIAILIIVGCAPLPKPEFNQTYLPNTVPGSPLKRIVLTQAVIDKVSVKEKVRRSYYLISYLPASMYWIEKDNLLFNIFSQDYFDTLLYSFLVIPSTGQIKLLEGAEKDALLSKMEKSLRYASSETLADDIAKTTIGVLSALTGGPGIRFKKDYNGKLENNGTDLNFIISLKYHRGGAFSSAYYDCHYTVTNSRTGTTFEANRRIKNEDVGEYKLNDDTVKYEVKDWLKSWRVSPDGRYYMIGKTAIFVDPEKKSAFTALIENYSFTGFDISPGWDEIALLIIKEDEKTKQMNYSIEFYPFSYRNK